MQVNFHEDRGIRVLDVLGDALDASNAPRFRTAIDAQVESGKYVLDLSNLSFVDSSGIGALLSCLRKVTALGGEVRLAGLQPSVANLFKLVRMDRLFEIFPTVDEAIVSYSN